MKQTNVIYKESREVHVKDFWNISDDRTILTWIEAVKITEWHWFRKRTKVTYITHQHIPRVKNLTNSDVQLNQYITTIAREEWQKAEIFKAEYSICDHYVKNETEVTGNLG